MKSTSINIFSAHFRQEFREFDKSISSSHDVSIENDIPSFDILSNVLILVESADRTVIIHYT